ncbi:MAG: beta-L-arabinofuranosidase domain-containing protein [Limisphaerales bacterium]
MHKALTILTCWLAILPLLQAAPTQPTRMVPFNQVTMTDPVWRPRIRDLVNKTLPHAFKNTRDAQERLRLTAELLKNGGGPKPVPHRFNTSDLYKVMEGASLMIQTEPNPDIEKQMDAIIDVIAAAQKDDGYLYVPHITGSIYENEMGPRPYSYVLHSHELYNIGHLYEAAVAYAQATGKTKLLQVAEKSAQHVNRVFFLGDPNYNNGKPVNQAPGHQEIEIGLVKLSNYTGNPLYLEMASKFLKIRGVTFIPDGTGVNSPTYAQQHQPVADQREAVGHAVRAAYQYAAMAEVDSLLSQTNYSTALNNIWHSLVDTKMHITGGLGAVHGIEGFGPPYTLPNKDTYLETCAAVGNVFFNLRMFLKYGDAKYLDVAEIALLNNCLSGIGLDGTSFFYPNPLEADADHAPRSGWFGTACCPANIARLIPQVPGMLYATRDNHLYCTLYGANTATIPLQDQTVKITQQTSYPYDGSITLTLTPESPATFSLHLRIPTWANRQPLPGKLYHYTKRAPTWTLTLNGQPFMPVQKNGFATINRKWQPGDTVTLNLPMQPQVNTCIKEVESNHDRIAISRGPLIFCAEGIDNSGAVQRFFLQPELIPDQSTTTTINNGPLKDLPLISIPAWEMSIERKLNPTQLHLIPYFAWSNRDRSSMITWIPTSPLLAQPDLANPANLKFKSVTASHTFEGDTTTAIRMRHTPTSSADTSIRRWTSWPQKGREQWVEIELDTPTTVRSLSVYYYNDDGGVQLPGSWHLETEQDKTWTPLPIYNTDSFSSLPDTFNTVHPATPLLTSKLRLVMQPRHDQTCVGILALDIETTSTTPPQR